MRWLPIAADPPAASRWRRRSMWLLAAVVSLGLTGTGLAATALRHADQDRITRALAEKTTLVSTMAAAEIRRYTDFLADLAAALGAQERVEAPEFAAATTLADRRRLPGASGVSFVVPATADQVPQVQSYWRARGVTGLTLRTAGASDEHYFVVLSRTFDGASAPMGRDLSAAPEASEAMRAARATSQVTSSRTYHLLRDARLPAAQRQLSFVFTVPVIAASPAAEDAGRFRGWLIMGLRGDDFLRQTIGAAAGDHVAVTLSDGTAAGSTRVAGWTPRAGLDDDTEARQVDLDASQRTWQLAVRPTKRLLPATDVHRDVIALIIGGTITGLLAVLTRILLTSRKHALRQVALATAALHDDIARREAVEKQLRQRESELRGFAGVVAHDLRNPLARVAGYADVLREYAGLLPPPEQKLLDRMHAGTRQMQILIDDLLDYATADNRGLQPVEIDLHRLVEDVVQDRVPPDGDPRPAITIGWLPTVEGDHTLLRQVFDNLIGNAVKYTRIGHPPQVSIAALPAGDDLWRIEVRDQGIGIPPEQRTDIFEAFVRAPGGQTFPGTGLGLAIVSRIIERHGGRIGVDGNPTGGSCFWFTLPRGDNPARSEPVVAANDRRSP